MTKISAVVSAYNEENNINDCLESLKWVDEIVVVDNTSLDKTVQIAKKFTPKIFTRINNQMLNINKNYGFEKAKGEWIINLDADERVSPELKKEILQIISAKGKYDGYKIPRKNILFNKWIQHGIWWPDYQIRLFKKDKGKFDCNHVHEKLTIKGEVGQLNNPFIHYNYRSVSQFVRKMNDIYTDNEADNFLKSGKQIHWYDSIRMPANDFLANFFARSSYKDGLHGLVLSILQSFYAFLVFCKVWEKQKFWEYQNKNFLSEVQEEFTRFNLDLGYWVRKSKLKGFLKNLLGR